jgi:hypothetical protein
MPYRKYRLHLRIMGKVTPVCFSSATKGNVQTKLRLTAPYLCGT